MGKLKAQIRESFFNPILQVFPVLVFIIITYIFERKYAWYGSLTFAVGLSIYVRAAYKGLYKWYMFYMLLFFVIASLMSIAPYVFKPGATIALVLDEIVFLFTLLVLLLLKKQIIKLSDKLVSPLIPMGNNISELFKNINIFIALVSGYLLVYFIFRIVDNSNTLRYITILNYTFVGLWILLIIYDFIKTKFVRSQLAGERWLPIITKEGKVIGTIQRLSSLSDRRKYMHPIIRGILVNEGRVLVQKPVDEDDIFYKPHWDNLISRHINIGEKAEDSLRKTAFEYFGIENIKSFYLTKYMYDTPFEHQYVLVFIICNYSGELIPNPKRIAQMKWWTMPQIESNLDSGIFDERFIKEYELLKRSGLLESEEYNCRCEDEEIVEEEIPVQKTKARKTTTTKKTKKEK